MKYLEIESLQKLTTFLSGRRVGLHVLEGRVEAFSCAFTPRVVYYATSLPCDYSRPHPVMWAHHTLLSTTVLVAMRAVLGAVRWSGVYAPRSQLTVALGC